MVSRKTTREILAESFRDLAEHKPVTKITVREITDNCGYSPATFYRHFKDKYELIGWDYAQTVDGIMRQVGVGGFPWNRTLLEGARYFQDHHDYLVNLLSHTSGWDSFEKSLVETNSRSLKQCIIRLSDGQTDLARNTELCIRLYCMGTVHLCCEWLTGKFQAEPEDMAEVWERALPTPLVPFLYV